MPANANPGNTNPSNTNPRIMIVAGEHSGDILGAGLVAELKLLYPQASFVGVAGERLKAEGVESVFPLEDLNVMGLLEVVPHLRRLFARRDTLVEYAVEQGIDLLITIDFQQFNASLANKIKQQCGVPCVHYVSPTVWAWRSGRVKKMARYLDHVLALFPFEPDWYTASGLPCTFVGHPLAQEMKGMAKLIPVEMSDQNIIQVALLPGSREGLIRKLLPNQLIALRTLVQQFPNLRVVVPVVKSEHREIVAEIAAENLFDTKLIRFVAADEKNVALAECDLAIAASGTSNLELAMLGIPMLIVYQFNKLTYFLLKPFVNAPYGSPVNWVAGRQILPELIQDNFTVDNILKELKPLISDPVARTKQLVDLKAVREALGINQEVAASKKAADIVATYL